MKLFFTLLFSSFIFIVSAQVPKEISYQGIARGSSGTVLANQTIGVQFKIHQGAAAGTVVFSETHSANTNAFGLFVLPIGAANPTAFAAIDWSQSPYFIEVSIDPVGGTAYISVGITPLISVPYALYAEKAGNATPIPTLSINSPNTISNPSLGVYDITVPAQTLNLAGNTLSISNGNTVTFPAPPVYSAGSGIDITGNVITNTAPDQTITISGTGVSGTYPNFTITPVAASTTTLVQGQNVLLNQAGNTYTVSSVTPTLSVIGGTLAGTYPTQTLSIPAASVTNLTGSSNITVSGVAPNYTISSPSQSLAIVGNSLSITGANTVTIPATSVTAGSNVSVIGSSPNYTVSAPSYVLGTSSNSITLTNGVNSSSVAVPVQSLSLVGTTLTAGPVTNSVNLATLPSSWTVATGVIYPTTLTNSVGIGTSGPLTDKMEINHPSTPTNTHLHLKQTGADAFSRLKFSNAIAPTKYWLNSVTSAATDNNSGFNVYYYNGTIGRNLFTVAGDGKVSVNPFSLAYPTLFEVNGHITLDSSQVFNGMNVAPPVSIGNSGKIYFDGLAQRFMVSENGGVYKPLIGTGPWTQGAGNVFLTNSADKVGIGLSTPSVKLDINDAFSGNGGTAVNVYATSSSSVGANSAIYTNIDGSSSGNYISGYFRSAGLAGATGNYTGAKGFAIGNSGSTGLAVGIDGNGQGANQNYGVSAMAIGSSGVTNYGVYAEASGVGSNYAIFAVANGTVGNSYAAYLRGHTYNEGKFALGAITSTPTAFINQGTMYYDNASSKIMVSENGQPYKPLFGPQPWVQAVGSVTLANVSDKVGIGTSVPQNKLHIIETATVAAINVNNSGSGEAINAIGGTGRSIYASSNAGGMSTIETTNLNSGYALNALKSYSVGGVVSISNSSISNAFEPLYVSTMGSGAAVRAAVGTAAASALSLHLDNGHLKSTQVASPTVSTFSVSGGISSLTYTLNAASDVKGSLLAVATTTGMINSGGNAVIKITFNKAYTVSPVVVVSPTSDLGALSYYVTAVTPNSFNIVVRNNTATNISGSSFNFNFNYFVIE